MAFPDVVPRHMHTNDIPLVVHQLRRSCRSCGLYELCLPAGIDESDLAQLDMAVRDRRVLAAGDSLFRQDDPFTSLYVVRSGSLKTMVADADGEWQVLGFHLPGEIVGVDAMAHDRHLCHAEALERTSVCELPYLQLQQVLTEVPGLQRQLLRVVSREVASEQSHLVTMGKQQAQERLAIFLRSLSERFGRLSRDTVTLNLTMSRYDIASYLGLVVETVSRLFTKMEAAGVLTVSRKHIVILRPDLLAIMCGSQGAKTPATKRENAQA
ncbi:MAG: cyclic nucleotide-binding domain-containing protein [Pseudomonadota bacterium]|nr:cyclic nucleotide-binding domain-containing protein [Pseudomonadota bacterium]